MRVVIILLVITGFALFWPRYNLEVRSSGLSDEKELVAEGFWSKSACEAKGQDGYQGKYQCVKYTQWQNMSGASEDYNEERPVE